MSDAEVWLILANGLSGKGVCVAQVAADADILLIHYKKRFDPEYIDTEYVESSNDG